MGTKQKADKSADFWDKILGGTCEVILRPPKTKRAPTPVGIGAR